MKRHLFKCRYGRSFAFSLWAVAISGLLLAPSAASAQAPYVVKPVAQKKIKQLPPGATVLAGREFPHACGREGRSRSRRVEPGFGQL